MNSLAQPADIFQLTREIPIVDVIHRYCPGLELKRQGREFVARCPFHQERTPSFTVNPDKGLFYCFGCGAGGDSIRFVAELLRLTPLEAARTIARDFGLSVDDRPLTRQARRKLAEARRKAALEKAIATRLEAEIERTHQAVCLLLRTATATLARALSRRDIETVEGLSDWLKWLPRLEYIADRLYSPDAEERMAALEEAAEWTG